LTDVTENFIGWLRTNTALNRLTDAELQAAFDRAKDEASFSIADGKQDADTDKAFISFVRTNSQLGRVTDAELQAALDRAAAETGFAVQKDA
jgi:hypothetical protein